MSLPPLEYLRECLRYDPDTGRLFWLARPRSHFGSDRAHAVFISQFSGREAGTRGPACVAVKLSGRLYKAHRLAWLLHYGVEPPSQVDHRDGDPHNNRLDNLRLASNQQNQFNRSVSRRSSSGLKGAYWDKTANRWRSQITVNRRAVFLGHYDTPEQAAAAYAEGARRYAKEFART